MMRIIFNHFPQLAAAMGQSVADIVEDAAEGILERADETVRAIAYRTGELARSGRTDYSPSGTKAIAGYDDYKAVWNEYGTGRPGPTPAQPFLTPAAEAVRPRFEAALRSLEPRIKVNLKTGRFRSRRRRRRRKQ